MKPNKTTNTLNRTTGKTLKQACLGACSKIAAQVARAKDAILAESRQLLGAPERMVQLALNEAEAVAWQTEYPHLVFPALAMEKVQSVAAWNHRQASVRSASRSELWAA
jgi:hypothetical protein